MGVAIPPVNQREYMRAPASRNLSRKWNHSLFGPSIFASGEGSSRSTAAVTSGSVMYSGRSRTAVTAITKTPPATKSAGTARRATPGIPLRPRHAKGMRKGNTWIP